MCAKTKNKRESHQKGTKPCNKNEKATTKVKQTASGKTRGILEKSGGETRRKK